MGFESKITRQANFERIDILFQQQGLVNLFGLLKNIVIDPLYFYKKKSLKNKGQLPFKKCLKLSLYWFISPIIDWLEPVARVRYIFLWLYAIQ